MLERDSWQALAGGNDARIFPFLRKPDITSCNSYLIETKQQIVLIDPGALPEQWDALMEQVSLLVKERARPVVIYLTHAHLDHSLSAISCQTPDDLMPIQVAIHQQGVAVLKQGDRKLSMAELYGCDFPCYEPAITLMANADVQEVATGAEAGSRPAHKLLRQCIDLGAGDTLEVYHTPGHSPDSVCYRLGEALFISDLLSATQPMVAGIIGWNRDEYIRSARHLLMLLEQGGISVYYPGHGPAMPAEMVQDILRKVVKEAQNLDQLKLVDRQRLVENKAYSLELLDELARVFTIISGRLYALAYRLEFLGEEDEASRYRKLLDAEGIEGQLLEFNGIVEQCRSGEKLELHLVFAAMKAVRGILKKFDQKQFAKIIDNSYLRRAAQALTDFLTAVRGFDVAPDAEELDLNALLEAFVGDMSANVHADRSIYETLHDNQQYLDALAARVAHVPIFSDLEIEHIAESRLNPVWLDRQRFNDALQGLLEQLTVAGAGKIVLTTRRKEDQNYLEVVAEQTSQNPDASLRLASHSRRFAACGVVMAPLELASGCGVALRLP